MKLTRDLLGSQAVLAGALALPLATNSDSFLGMLVGGAALAIGVGMKIGDWK